MTFFCQFSDFVFVAETLITKTAVITTESKMILPTTTQYNKRNVTALKGSDSDVVTIVYDKIFDFTDFEPFVDQLSLTLRPATPLNIAREKLIKSPCIFLTPPKIYLRVKG